MRICPVCVNVRTHQRSCVTMRLHGGPFTQTPVISGPVQQSHTRIMEYPFPYQGPANAFSASSICSNLPMLSSTYSQSLFFLLSRKLPVTLRRSSGWTICHPKPPRHLWSRSFQSLLFLCYYVDHSLSIVAGFLSPPCPNKLISPCKTLFHLTANRHPVRGN